MTDTMVVTVLEDALTLLETRGWGKGSYHNWETGCYCAVGALLNAAGIPGSDLPAEDWEQAFDTASEAVEWAAGFDTTVWSLIGWNDRQERTKDEVLAAFRRAIASEKGVAA